MTKRICDSCGLEKDIYQGKTCEKGHFICKACVPQAGLDTLISGYNPKCPLCSKPLR